MFDHLVVPVDMSSAALNAIPIAARMADAVAGRVEVLAVVDRVGDVPAMRTELGDAVAALGPLAVTPELVVDASHSVTSCIERRLEASEGAMVLMSSHGHGRTAALLGNTVDEVLRSTFGPVIVVGPHVDAAAGRLDGTYLVPLDGSERADGVLAIVAPWSVEFGGTPWLVEALDDAPPSSSDVSEASYVQARATRLTRQIGREVDFEVLHGSHPAREITDYATTRDASLIFMATHGRTGLDRLRCGSIAADVIRHARCPVVVFRPPELVTERERAPVTSARI